MFYKIIKNPNLKNKSNIDVGSYGFKKLKICSKTVFRRNIFNQGTGLMFHKKIFDEAHIFVFKKEKNVPLTNWFVFFPIDILFLDKNKNIVELKKEFKPFTNYFPKKDSMYVVEVPSGCIKNNNLNIGDLCYF